MIKEDIKKKLHESKLENIYEMDWFLEKHNSWPKQNEMKNKGTGQPEWFLLVENQNHEEIETTKAQIWVKRSGVLRISI